MLKMRLQIFSFANKKVQGFSSDRKILISLSSVLFYLQNHVSGFWNFDFYPRYFWKRSLCPWNQFHLLRNSDKSLLSPEQNKLKKKSDTRSCRQKTAEDYYAKINVSPNIPCTILPFKASAFFQIFFRRNLPFRQVLRRSVFLSVVKVWYSSICIPY